MQKILLAILSVLFPVIAQAWPGVVLSVQDGDTLTVAPSGDADCPVVVRLYGIDAPEKKQDGGAASTAYLADLLPGGSSVEVVPLDADKYGRLVALVMHEGRAINAQMLRAGHAWVYAKYCRAAMCKMWYTLQKDAAAAQKGLWREAMPVTPWVWRKIPRQE